MGRARLLSAALVVASAVVASSCGDTGASATGECYEQPFTTESGVRIRDLSCGEGAVAARGRRVTIAYTAELSDGTPVGARRSFTFPLGAGQVIAGWDEGIPTMRAGGTRRLEVPAELAYGDGGFGDVVPPGATLLFEVELLRVAGD